MLQGGRFHFVYLHFGIFHVSLVDKVGFHGGTPHIINLLLSIFQVRLVDELALGGSLVILLVQLIDFTQRQLLVRLIWSFSDVGLEPLDVSNHLLLLSKSLAFLFISAIFRHVGWTRNIKLIDGYIRPNHTAVTSMFRLVFERRGWSNLAYLWLFLFFFIIFLIGCH